MTKEQVVILSLIRTAVTGKVEALPNGVDWASVINLATAQGVLGLCFEAVERLAPDQRPDMDNLMDMLGQVEYMKTCYEEHRKAIEGLSSFYKSHEIKMMLLKGYGLSLYWPTPEHRPVGDIDIYLRPSKSPSLRLDSGQVKGNLPIWKFADQMVHDKLGIEVDDGHEHHTCFSFRGISVENHYDFVNTKVNESSRELEVIFKRMAEETFNLKPFEGHNHLKLSATSEALKLTETNLFFPSPTLNAIFLIRHMGQHFAGAEASLRLLLDWGFFMMHESENVDWELVIPVLKKAGIYEFFLHVNAICVDYLGFDEFKGFKSLRVDKALEKRILEDILSPEFAEEKPKGNVVSVIAFKTRRFFANRWKRNLVYRESMWSQLLHGCIAHLKRFSTIKD